MLFNFYLIYSLESGHIPSLPCIGQIATLRIQFSHYTLKYIFYSKTQIIRLARHIPLYLETSCQQLREYKFKNIQNLIFNYFPGDTGHI